jgi:hypothetical protein
MSKNEDIINRRKISARLIPAMIEPIIVSQFLDDGGSFIKIRFYFSVEVKI